MLSIHLIPKVPLKRLESLPEGEPDVEKGRPLDGSSPTQRSTWIIPTRRDFQCPAMLLTNDDLPRARLKT